MTRIGVAALALTALTGITLAGAVPADAAPARNRGSLLSVTSIGEFSPAKITANLTSDGFSYQPSQLHNSVHAYQLTYRTVAANGQPTTATGLFVLPDNNNPIPQVITYLHGTMSGKDEAPSMAAGGDQDASYLFASAGYAVVAPDYVGLGDGPGQHPYLDVADATDATVDLLRAARTAAGQDGRLLRPDVLVTGFSQGGPVAMGTGRALQDGAAPGMWLAAAAPISGPFDLQHQEIPAALSGQLNQADSAYYLAYALTAWQRTYRIYDNAAQVFQAPYDTTMPRLFDGDYDEDVIFPQLPSTPEQLLTPAYLAELAHPTGRLLAALRANDRTCADWRPQAPIRFFYGSSDEQVANGNTMACRAQLAANGVAASLVDVGPVGHLESGKLAATQVLAWFEQLSR